MPEYYIGVGVDRAEINDFKFYGKEKKLVRGQKEIGLQVASTNKEGSKEWENEMYDTALDALEGTDWGAVDYIVIDKIYK